VPRPLHLVLLRLRAHTDEVNREEYDHHQIDYDGDACLERDIPPSMCEYEGNEISLLRPATVRVSGRLARS
jgi:hypothetical protein